MVSIVPVVPAVPIVPVVTMVSCDGGTSYETVLVVACCGSGSSDNPVVVPLSVLRRLLTDMSPEVAPDVPNTLAANKY